MQSRAETLHKVMYQSSLIANHMWSTTKGQGNSRNPLRYFQHIKVSTERSYPVSLSTLSTQIMMTLIAGIKTSLREKRYHL